MKTIVVKDVINYLGEEICLKGWVRNYRKSSSKLRFIVFRDGSGEIQAIAARDEMGEEKFDRVKSLTIESSVMLCGIATKHPTQENTYEIMLTDCQPIQIAPEYPIGKKEHGADFLLSNRHLWIRSKKQWALLRLRHAVYFAVCDFLNMNDFIRFDAPILTPNACEGTTTLFELPYFEEGFAYLSQSGQLYQETGIMSFGRVYDFGPVFRAEKSKTRKHLTEFWMMDAEMAFMDMYESIKLQEELIRYVIRTVAEKYRNELEILERDVERLLRADAPFLHMTHREAIDLLRSKGSEIGYEDDFGAMEEGLLTEGSDVPLFVEKWPRKIKAFYMKRDDENPDVVLGADLIAPEGFGEIIGGSQREDNLDLLLARMEEEKIPREEYEWYLDLRKFGSVPHSGFGIGLERLVTWISGVQHIRETIPYPRMIYRLKP